MSGREDRKRNRKNRDEEEEEEDFAFSDDESEEKKGKKRKKTRGSDAYRPSGSRDSDFTLPEDHLTDIWIDCQPTKTRVSDARYSLEIVRINPCPYPECSAHVPELDDYKEEFFVRIFIKNSVLCYRCRNCRSEIVVCPECGHKSRDKNKKFSKLKASVNKHFINQHLDKKKTGRHECRMGCKIEDDEGRDTEMPLSLKNVDGLSHYSRHLENEIAEREEKIIGAQMNAQEHVEPPRTQSQPARQQHPIRIDRPDPSIIDQPLIQPDIPNPPDSMEIDDQADSPANIWDDEEEELEGEGEEIVPIRRHAEEDFEHENPIDFCIRNLVNYGTVDSSSKVSRIKSKIDELRKISPKPKKDLKYEDIKDLKFAKIEDRFYIESSDDEIVRNSCEELDCPHEEFTYTFPIKKPSITGQVTNEDFAGFPNFASLDIHLDFYEKVGKENFNSLLKKISSHLDFNTVSWDRVDERLKENCFNFPDVDEYSHESVGPEGTDTSTHKFKIKDLRGFLTLLFTNELCRSLLSPNIEKLKGENIRIDEDYTSNLRSDIDDAVNEFVETKYFKNLYKRFYDRGIFPVVLLLYRDGFRKFFFAIGNALPYYVVCLQFNKRATHLVENCFLLTCVDEKCKECEHESLERLVKHILDLNGKCFVVEDVGNNNKLIKTTIIVAITIHDGKDRHIVLMLQLPTGQFEMFCSKCKRPYCKLFDSRARFPKRILSEQENAMQRVQDLHSSEINNSTFQKESRSVEKEGGWNLTEEYETGNITRYGNPQKKSRPKRKVSPLFRLALQKGIKFEPYQQSLIEFSHTFVKNATIHILSCVLKNNNHLIPTWNERLVIVQKHVRKEIKGMGKITSLSNYTKWSFTQTCDFCSISKWVFRDDLSEEKSQLWFSNSILLDQMIKRVQTYREMCIQHQTFKFHFAIIDEKFQGNEELKKPSIGWRECGLDEPKIYGPVDVFYGRYLERFHRRIKLLFHHTGGSFPNIQVVEKFFVFVGIHLRFPLLRLEHLKKKSLEVYVTPSISYSIVEESEHEGDVMVLCKSKVSEYLCEEFGEDTSLVKLRFIKVLMINNYTYASFVNVAVQNTLTGKLEFYRIEELLEVTVEVRSGESRRQFMDLVAVGVPFQTEDTGFMYKFDKDLQVTVGITRKPGNREEERDNWVLFHPLYCHGYMMDYNNEINPRYGKGML